MTKDIFGFARNMVREQFTPTGSLPTVPSLECEVCPKKAWAIDRETKDERVVTSYVCPNGHLKIVTEVAA